MFEYLIDVFKSLLVSVTICIFGVFLWYMLWLKKEYLSIPIGHYNYPCDNKEKIYIFRGLKDFFSKFRHIFIELDADYWIENCGLDVYAYLYFQRKILKLLACIALIAICTIIPYNLMSKHEFSFFLHNENNKIDFKSERILAIQVILITSFTISCLYFVFSMKVHIQSVFETYYSKQNKLALKYLQFRSLHIKGMIQEDIRGEALYQNISEHLYETNSGKMVAIKIVPNYAKLVDIDNQRTMIEMMQKIYTANEPNLRK